MNLHPIQYQDLVRRALEEDLGDAGDLTSQTLIEASAVGVARFEFREPGIVAGLMVAREVCLQVDPRIEFQELAADGDRVEAMAVVARVKGPVSSLLTAERVALNFLGRMCGIATLTRRYVDAIAGTGTKVVCTRKTTPTLRALEKYSVRMGGGQNHRFGLYDGILIKDNHIAALGSINAAIKRAKERAGHMVMIEAEVTSLNMLREALDAGAQVVLLDNMSPEQIKDCVAIAKGRATTEASGGIRLDNIRQYAEAGVDRISVGRLTHSAACHDISLELETQ